MGKIWNFSVSRLMAGTDDNFMELWGSIREKKGLKELKICFDQ